MAILNPKQLNNPLNITGSLFGSSSYALTASYALNGGGGSTFPYIGPAVISGSLLISGSGLTVSGSSSLFGGPIKIDIPSKQSGYVLTSDGNGNATWQQPGAATAFPYNGTINPAVISGSLIVSGSGIVVTGSIISTQGFTGSLQGTSSWANNVVTASYISSSFFTGINSALSSSYAGTASLAPNYVLNSSTSSFLNTSSFNNYTSSVITTSSFNAFTSSVVTTSSFNAFTSSIVTTSSFNSLTSSFAITGSNRFNGNQVITGSVVISGSNINLTVSGSIISSAGFTGSLQGTSSWSSNAVTASYITSSFFTGTNAALSSSYAITASYSPNYLPLTGGIITGNVTVQGTASISYLNVTFESSSVIYSSGSNIFGDAADDIQTLYGTVVIPTGSLKITGSLIVSSSQQFIGATQITGSLSISGSGIAITGSVNLTQGSYNVNGVNVLDTALAYAIALG